MNPAFVTGATGLLGKNLVRALLKRNIQVTALARSAEKSGKQFANLPLAFVEEDLCHPGSYRAALQGCDSLFHTAACVRDRFKGGKHWQELYDANVKGAADLLQFAWKAGIRRVVHTSSIAVLQGEPNQAIDESMSRDREDKDDYISQQDSE